ncbi:MAG: fasciclin domain-containing protein [Archangium sp.]|nr:fasciclin domain-containing protein [Archangium sp.]
MKSLLIALICVLSTAAFAEEKPAKPTEAKKTEAKAAPKDIVDTAVAAGSFKTLATALTEAGLIETLKGPGPFTVFAPTDEAFAKVPKKDLEALLKDKKKLAAVLTYHVVAGKVMAADVVKLKDGSKVKTVEGRELTVGNKGGKVTVDAANVTSTDIEASNGVIHVIDSVILPK